MSSAIELQMGEDFIHMDLIDSRHRDDDIRFIYKIETKSGLYCLKLQHNLFTTIKRVNSTANLVNRYNELGVYAPRYIKLKNGTYSTYIKKDNRTFVMWVEEYSKYETIKDNKKFILSIDNDIQITEYIGKVATGLQDFKFEYKSPYVMYEPFDGSTVVDEYEEFLILVQSNLKDNLNINQLNLKYVADFFTNTRKKLKDQYNKLPSSVFQCDLQSENILMNDGNFTGVIDFNLAGREKVLTYFINETAYQEKGKIGEKWISNEYLEYHLNIFKEKIVIFQKFYKFNNKEIDIFNDLYKVIVPFKFYPLSEIIGYFKLGEYDEVNYQVEWMKRLIEKDLKFNI